MDDDSCVMKYIEIVPLDNSRNCSDSSDVKFNPADVKVCVFYFILLQSFNLFLSVLCSIDDDQTHSDSLLCVFLSILGSAQSG